MEIVINRTGNRYHLDVPIAKALIDCGLAEQYVPPAYNPTTPAIGPQWSVAYRVCINESNRWQGDKVPPGKILVIEFNNGAMGKIWFDGLPAGAKAHFAGMGYQCPDDVAAQYKEIYGNPRKSLVQK
jgi:hypothetical protein